MIDRDVTIIGPGARTLAINGNRASRIFHITNNVTVSLSGLMITNGSTGAGGGGILADNGTSTLIVSNCTISGNAAGGSGGGINKLSGATALINCLVCSNTASVAGGGVNGAAVNMTNCTVSGNVSVSNGGGIFAAGDLRLVHCTVSSNTSTVGGNSGGGIFRNGRIVTLGNTIIAGNTGGTSPDCGGAFVSAGYNLIGNTAGSSGFGTIGDQLNVNPLLGPLADNGGPTFCRALLPGSPAIEQGTAAGTFADQRGRARPYVSNPSASLPFGGDHSDIGSYELSPITFIVTTTNEHGTGSLRQILLDAPPADWITFAPDVAGAIVLTNGELVMSKSVSIIGPANSRVTISGNTSSRVLRVTAGSTVSISGLTIANGNSASQGAGAYVDFGGALSLSNCAVSGNISGDNGGGIANNGSFAAYNCTFAGNQAFYTGGAIYTVTVRRSRLTLRGEGVAGWQGETTTISIPHNPTSPHLQRES